LKYENCMYLKWDEKIITDFSDRNVEDMYDRGYVFTRLGKGVMQQTRSLRINLNKFDLSSENKRVLKRTEDLEPASPKGGFTIHDLESGDFEYKWGMGKLAKDFYDRFGEKTFSANKAKELLTVPSKSNFNILLDFDTGYVICYASKNIFHYTYPFYSLSRPTAKDLGLGMMTRAIIWAKEQNKKFIYLGSASRTSDTYKLQFTGLEWWDRGSPEQGEGGWNNDTTKLKRIITPLR